MKINPLAVFTGLTLATLGTLVVVEKDKWMGEDAVLAKVEAPAQGEAPAKLESTAKVEEPAKLESTAKVEEPAKVEEAAKVDAPAAPVAIIPSFDTVRVEPNGDTIIAGRAEPGAEVVIKLNGATIGTAMANVDGAFVVTPEKPLPAGPGALSIETKSNNMIVASADTVAVDVKSGAASTPLVAVLKQDEPTKVIQAPAANAPALVPSATVVLDSVDYDENGNIVFGGRGPVGSKVQVYVDNNPYGSATIGPKGGWSMAGVAPMAIGAHELRADELAADGSVKSRVGMPFYREDPKIVAKAAPVAVPEPAPATVVAAAPGLKVEMVEKPLVTAPVTEVSKTAEPAPALVAAAPEVAAAPVVVVVEPAAPVQSTDNTQVATAPVVTPPEPTRIVIQPGNNLWKLSRKIYGKGIRYTVIYEANKDQIRKPGLIYPGQILVTPDAPPAQ